MSIETRIKPFERDVLFDLSGLSPEEQSAALAEFARQEIDAAAAQNKAAIGHSVDYETFVDGVKSDRFEIVAPNGIIVAEFDLGSDLIQWIVEQILKHAPYLTGRFRKSIRIFADGVEVDSWSDIPEGVEEIVITSVVPYARKIEEGKSTQAPDGVFEAVAAMAAARYGNQANIRFTYREPMGGATELESWARAHSAQSTAPRNSAANIQKTFASPRLS